VQAAPGSGHQVQIALPIEQAENIDLDFTLLMRDLPQKS
jgi:hypothetical protein